MSEQGTIDFNLAASIRAKEEGMQRAAEPRESSLDLARYIAVEIATKKGIVTADDVGKELAARGCRDLGPAAGHLFSDKRFVWTGEFTKSSRKTNHARLLRVWRLK